MLVTTCPGCDTTFKLTVAILEKAGGQVRCGRCARIFDANSRLREEPESETEQLPAAARALADAPTDDELAFVEAIASTTGTRWFLQDDPPDAADAVPAAAGSEPTEPAAGLTESRPEESESPAPETAAAGSVESQVTGLEIEALAIAESAASATDPAGAGPPASTRWRSSALDWLDGHAEAEPVRRRTWPWAAAAGLMALTLAAQLIHAARSELAALPGVGPALIAAYATFGREVAPPVALAQYASLDLTAVAEPVTDEHGWLIIETRVQNRGPKVQPYPYILIRIRDRWEETIAGRYFAPDEYVVTPQPDYSRMNVGSTVDAQFIIVDPGTDATGFELEFCARVDGAFVCDSQ